MIVAVTGLKQSGKDTVANFLIKNYGYAHVSFAYPIKHVLRYLFSWDEEHTDGELKEVVDPFWGVSPRQVMQWFGTEAFQYNLGKHCPKFEETIGRGMWVQRLMKNIKPWENSGKYVISDMRFYHEYEALKKYGAYTIRVERQSAMHDDLHASETSILDLPVDVVIENNADLETLYQGVETAMAYFNYLESAETVGQKDEMEKAS